MKLNVSTLICASWPDVDETDVPVRDHGFDFEHGIGRHDDSQLLRRRHHAAHGMNRKLLHDAVDRRGQELKLGSLLRLHEIAG